MVRKPDNEEKNVNEPGGVPEERPYYDTEAEKEELVKVPVEYLGYLSKRQKSRVGKVLLWILLGIFVVGFGPGTNGRDLCPRNGETRRHFTFAWGQLAYADVPKATDWTRWYEASNGEVHHYHWIPVGVTRPALFGFLKVPFGGVDHGLLMPDNLASRIRELDPMFTPQNAMVIARVLNAVDNGIQWNAIVLPLTVGTPEEAFAWWKDHEDMLISWSEQPYGTVLDPMYVAEAAAYVESNKRPDGNYIPLY